MSGRAYWRDPGVLFGDRLSAVEEREPPAAVDLEVDQAGRDDTGVDDGAGQVPVGGQAAPDARDAVALDDDGAPNTVRGPATGDCAGM